MRVNFDYNWKKQQTVALLPRQMIGEASGRSPALPEGLYCYSKRSTSDVTEFRDLYYSITARNIEDFETI